MTELPPPPWPAPVAPPPAKPPRRRARMLIALGIVLAGVLTAGIGIVLARQDGPSHPDQWDERVLDIVSFVERERDLRFDHPVTVDFLTAEEYTEEATVAESELTDDEQTSMTQSEGMWRALGLAEGPLDLLDASNEISDEGTAAFYSPDDERVVVRGTEMTVDLRVTMAHELTHALQHQRFGDGPDEDASSGEHFAFRALFEGDASRIEDRYVAEELTADEREAYETSSAEQSESARDDIEAPDAFLTFVGAPYALGGGFIDLLDADGGNDRIDDAFDEPPTSAEQLFDPSAFIDGDAPALLDPPSLPDDAELVDEGDWGAVGWYVMLAEWIDPLQALDAVDGWKGDAVAIFSMDERTCVRLAWSGDSADDVDEMESALDAWAGELPAVAPTVDRDGTIVRVEACDPGADAHLGITGRSSDALRYPAGRLYFAASARRDGGLPLDESLCVGDALIHSFTIEELSADELPDDVFDRMHEAMSSCD